MNIKKAIAQFICKCQIGKTKMSKSSDIFGLLNVLDPAHVWAF